ncbi:MAG: flagellar basal body P-ring formation chaperone FlgA [Chitinispirillales bacterium]|nr:flagellar basal body P-ring formation chaperone FlgA [Chitinispirillales bacterium]
MLRNFNYNNLLARIAKMFLLVVALKLIAFMPLHASSRAVTLNFVDSVMINDTLIRLGDIARVISDDAALANRLRAFPVGEAAPAGFNRFVNTEDLMMFRIQPQFRDIRFVSGNSRRIKVLSDHQERTVSEYEELIRSYVAGRLGWAAGEWELSINNLRNTWKTGRGQLDVEVAGLDNPFSKGNINLTIVARQGSRTYRVPVQCRITVRAPVLVATRLIRSGEEFTRENSTIQVIDITNFAFTPLRQLPESGTMTTIRTASLGNILHDRMLRPIPLVVRGDQVRIHFVGEKVNVSVLGVARDSGSQGDRIWVENLQSGKLIRAAVSGRGSVVVHQEGVRS